MLLYEALLLSGIAVAVGIVAGSSSAGSESGR